MQQSAPFFIVVLLTIAIAGFLTNQNHPLPVSGEFVGTGQKLTDMIVSELIPGDSQWSGVARTNEVVMDGFPLQRGLIPNAVIGQSVPLILADATSPGKNTQQFNVMGLWDDGSAKWVMASTLEQTLAAGGKDASSFSMWYDPATGGSTPGSICTSSGSKVTVNTGTLQAEIKNNTGFNVFDSLIVNTAQIISPGNVGGIELIDSTGTVYNSRYGNVQLRIVYNGPIVCRVLAIGDIRDSSGTVDLATYYLQMDFVKGRDHVRTVWTLSNGDVNKPAADINHLILKGATMVLHTTITGGAPTARFLSAATGGNPGTASTQSDTLGVGEGIQVTQWSTYNNDNTGANKETSNARDYENPAGRNENFFTNCSATDANNGVSCSAPFVEDGYAVEVTDLSGAVKRTDVGRTNADNSPAYQSLSISSGGKVIRGGFIYGDYFPPTSLFYSQDSGFFELGMFPKQHPRSKNDWNTYGGSSPKNYYGPIIMEWRTRRTLYLDLGFENTGNQDPKDLMKMATHPLFVRPTNENYLGDTKALPGGDWDTVSRAELDQFYQNFFAPYGMRGASKDIGNANPKIHKIEFTPSGGTGGGTPNNDQANKLYMLYLYGVQGNTPGGLLFYVTFNAIYRGDYTVLFTDDLVCNPPFNGGGTADMNKFSDTVPANNGFVSKLNMLNNNIRMDTEHDWLDIVALPSWIATGDYIFEKYILDALQVQECLDTQSPSSNVPDYWYNPKDRALGMILQNYAQGVEYFKMTKTGEANGPPYPYNALYLLKHVRDRSLINDPISPSKPGPIYKRANISFMNSGGHQVIGFVDDGWGADPGKNVDYTDTSHFNPAIFANPKFTLENNLERFFEGPLSSKIDECSDEGDGKDEIHNGTFMRGTIMPQRLLRGFYFVKDLFKNLDSDPSAQQLAIDLNTRMVDFAYEMKGSDPNAHNGLHYHDLSTQYSYAVFSWCTLSHPLGNGPQTHDNNYIVGLPYTQAILSETDPGKRQMWMDLLVNHVQGLEKDGFLNGKNGFKEYHYIFQTMIAPLIGCVDGDHDKFWNCPLFSNDCDDTNANIYPGNGCSSGGYCGDLICNGGETCSTCVTDCDPSDKDGICTANDNCPSIYNPGQQDCDGDGQGDACDSSSICGGICGDGHLDSGEQCDDGNTQNNDGCHSDCTSEFCGNNRREGTEVCDGTDSAACPGQCTLSCTCGSASCGNSVCESGETPQLCPQDCAGTCPDGFCNPYFEAYATCAQDCPDTHPPNATIEINLNASNTQNVKVNLGARYNDSESGLPSQACTFSSDGISYNPYQTCVANTSWILQLAPGIQRVYFNVTDNAKNVRIVSDTINVSLKITAGKYNGSTTKFSAVNPFNISNMILDRAGLGSIYYLKNISFNTSRNLDTTTNIDVNLIYVNSSNMSELNVSALLVFYGLDKLGIKDPELYRDGKPCPPSHCTIPSYTNGVLSEQVSGFSNYSVHEKPCIDLDGDGYNTTAACGVIDCNDANATIHPGATESCDMIDNTCDGVVDEGCQCVPGSTQTCGNDTGACMSGTQQCLSNGTWNSQCTGSIGPTNETCGNGIDEDCDGSDQQCAQTCVDFDLDGFDGAGILCVAGTDCNDANAAIHPGATDICGDGIDQDCDGSDQCTQNCTDNDNDGYTAIDPLYCTSGTDCIDTNATIHPGATDICGNGIDEDCSGQDSTCALPPSAPSCTDGQTRACGSGVGGCVQGTQTCAAGTWGVCVGGSLPSQEVCDGKDNNCNGQIDETTCQCQNGEQKACGSNIGACKEGIRVCDTKGNWGSCTNAKDPATEDTCGNSIDDDCNGEVDDKCTEAVSMCSNQAWDPQEEWIDCGGKCATPCAKTNYTGLIVALLLIVVVVGLVIMMNHF